MLEEYFKLLLLLKVDKFSIVNHIYHTRFMYAGAKKCIRQTLGWTAYVDDGWKDVDVTFTCAGGNPSEEYRILTTLMTGDKL